MILNLPFDSTNIYSGASHPMYDATDIASYNSFLGSVSGTTPCDVATPVNSSSANFSGDGLHLTQAGYNAVAAKVKSCLGW